MCGMWLFLVYLISFIEKYVCTQADSNEIISANVWASRVGQFMAARKQFQFLIDFNAHAKSEVWACLCSTVKRGGGAEPVALLCLHMPVSTPSQTIQVPF